MTSFSLNIYIFVRVVYLCCNCCAQASTSPCFGQRVPPVSTMCSVDDRPIITLPIKLTIHVSFVLKNKKTVNNRAPSRIRISRLADKFMSAKNYTASRNVSRISAMI